MSGPRALEAFPWGALSRTTRRAEARLWNARRRLEPAVVLTAFGERLAELTGTEIEIVVRDVDHKPPASTFWSLGFEAAGTGEHFGVGLEAPLGSALLSAFLRRPLPLVPSELSADPALLGALSALFVEAARGTQARDVLRPAPPRDASDAAIVHATLIVSGRPYAAAVWLGSELEPSAPGAGLLARLASIELELPLVIGATLTTPRVLATLRPGDALCPGPDLWVKERAIGRAALVAPTSEAGLGVELLPDGRIVVREPTQVALAAPESNVSQDAEPSALEQVVLDTPLVVRVELASVSLPAREWAALRAGDVIETRRRVGGPVVLRAGGRALAHGELVNLEGELGVRVTRVLPPEEAP